MFIGDLQIFLCTEIFFLDSGRGREADIWVSPVRLSKTQGYFHHLMKYLTTRCWYPADRVPLCTRLKSSSIALDSAPGREVLWYRHVSPRLQIRSRCRKALASPRALWHRARRLIGKGSGVATCPATPDLPPDAGGL
jgi:hypothetical protein